MSGTGDSKRDSHSDPAPQKKDRSDWWTNRKTFAEEVDENIAEMRIEVARAVRKVFESPD